MLAELYLQGSPQQHQRLLHPGARRDRTGQYQAASTGQQPGQPPAKGLIHRHRPAQQLMRPVPQPPGRIWSFGCLPEKDMKHDGMALRWQANFHTEAFDSKVTAGAQEVPLE